MNARSTTVRRPLALLGALALVLALVPFLAAPATAQDLPTDPPADGGQDALNLTGETNIEYAVRWSQVTYTPLDGSVPENAPTEALLGRNDLFPDSLASGVLQGTAIDNGRPLLLTEQDTLSAETLEELNRLSGRANEDATDDTDFTVHILGGVDAVSQSVADELEAAGFAVNRFEGETRIETAVEISAANETDTVLVVRAFPSADSTDETQAFADSLGAGALAATNGWDILFTQSDVLTANTAEALADQGYAQAYVVGGEAAISGDVMSEIDDIVDTVERVEGQTRFETAVALNELREGELGDVALLVDGQADDAWADGFPAANISGLNGYPLVLSNQGQIPEPTAAYLETFQDEVAAPIFTAHFTDVALVCGSTADAEVCAEALSIINGDDSGEVREFPPADDGEGVQSFTDAPELIAVTEEAAGEGTVQLRFTFDEDVTGQTPAAECFHLYAYDNTEFPGGTPDEGCTGHEGDANVNPASVDGTQATIPEDDASSVLVTFPVTEEEFATATVATVDWAAVTDVDDVENLEGAVALQPELTGGTTTAPDLVEVRAGDTDTEIAYVFDEPVATTVDQTGFVLIDADGGSATSESAVRSSTEGEEHVVIATFAADALAADPVRAGVLTATVTEDVAADAPEGAANPLQVVDVAASGATADPDVTGIAVDRDASTVTYTFDEAVDLAATPECAQVSPLPDPIGVTTEQALCFQVYDRTGAETDAAEVENTGSTVVATFPEGALDDALGASVEAQAVTAVQGDNNANEIDELPIEDLTLEAGRTPGPDLIDVAVAQDDSLGTTTVVEYTFDEEVIASEPNPITGGILSPDPARFFIYDAEGNPTRGTVAEVDESDATVVRVIFGEAEGTEETPSSDEAIAAAVTATVNDLAVVDADGDSNTEDAGGALR